MIKRISMYKDSLKLRRSAMNKGLMPAGGKGWGKKGLRGFNLPLATAAFLWIHHREKSRSYGKGAGSGRVPYLIIRLSYSALRKPNFSGPLASKGPKRQFGTNRAHDERSRSEGEMKLVMNSFSSMTYRSPACKCFVKPFKRETARKKDRHEERGREREKG